MKKMKHFILAALLLMSASGFAQETKQDKAKENWRGFNITLNTGLLEGNIDKYYGESATRWENDLNWQAQDLLNYSWGRGVENRSGYGIGLNLGYNWILPHRFLLGLEAGAAKTDVPFYLFGPKIMDDIQMRGTNVVVSNVDLKMVSNGSLVLGKVFGKKSDYLLYAKGGVTNGLMHFGNRNDYSGKNTYDPNNASGGSPAATPYVDNLWNWGWNAGGGVKYAVNSRLSVGLEYLYSKYNDMEQVTGSLSVPYEHEIRTKQHFNTHTVNLNLTLNLSPKKRKAQPVVVQTVIPEPVVIVDTVKVIEEKIVYVEKEQPKHEFGQPEVGKTIVLRNIYYDFDKSFIREDAKPDLNKVISYMREYPNIKIELKSHTDSRGSAAYNQALSQRRAQAATDYIVNAGISANRIVARGYGESQPVNGCVDGVSCSEEQHQQNRRTEFTVISID